jgi:multimeric flavodoxin WrbA
MHSISEEFVKIVAFNGSPRIGGNTDLLLQQTLHIASESGHNVTTYSLNDMDIKPCQDCGGCETTGHCIYDDEMSIVASAIRQCDRLILASPIFFFGLSAQTKIMIDRCQSFWCEKYLLKKPISGGEFKRKGLLILVGGMKNEIGIKGGEATAKAFFRTVSIPEHQTVSFLGIDAKGAIRNHETAYLDVIKATQKLVEVTEGE